MTLEEKLLLEFFCSMLEADIKAGDPFNINHQEFLNIIYKKVGRMEELLINLKELITALEAYKNKTMINKNKKVN